MTLALEGRHRKVGLSPVGRELERAPIGRSVVMAVVGGIAAVWALASLIGG
jgi:hypothetical protein